MTEQKIYLSNELIGEHIYLRPITYADTDLIIKWRNSDSVRKYFIYREPFTKEGHENWMKNQIETKKAFQFIVCDNESGRPIGCTYLRDYDKIHNKAEYGVFIGEEGMRGKGLGKEMLNLTMSFAFCSLGLHKVYARALSDNAASINCFLACGFEKEAYLKDEVYLDGKYNDIVLFGKLMQQ